MEGLDAMQLRILASLVLTALLGRPLIAQDKITLRETTRLGDKCIVRMEFRAEGNLMVPQSSEKDKPQSFSAKGRMEYEEKIVSSEPKPEGDVASAAASSLKGMRYYTASMVESVVENRRVARELREPVRLIVAEIREGRPFLFSPVAPLTVDEYEMVESDASLDTLTIAGLLPDGAVAQGATWRPSSESVAAIFNLTHIGNNELTVKLEKFDNATATLQLSGHVEGICSGTATLRTLSGQIVYDRNRSKIARLEVNHREERKAGPLTNALDVKANYALQRIFDTPFTQLKDADIAKVPTESNQASELLVYAQPENHYQVYLQRGWFVTVSHPQAAILRLLENGEFVSECHMLAAPTVAPGTHMKPDDFRNQVQAALGNQFQQFVQEGEVPAPRGLWIYRLAAAGMSNGQPAIWIYHVVAGPQGQQLVFIFRIHASQFDHFGAKDLAMVGTLEFEQPKTASSQK
jgi:hypothetical protein